MTDILLASLHVELKSEFILVEKLQFLSSPNGAYFRQKVDDNSIRYKFDLNIGKKVLNRILMKYFSTKEHFLRIRNLLFF